MMHNSIFWNLFIICEHSIREPASVVPDDEQGDLFYSAGPQRNLHQPQLTQEKLGGNFGYKIKGEWTKQIKIGKEEIPGSEHSMLGFKLDYSRL